SSHGTYVAGRRVSTVVLADGDEVRIGATRLRFEEGSILGMTSEVVIVDGPDGVAEVHGRVAVPPVHEQRFRPADAITDPDELRRDYEKLRAAYEVTRFI